MAIDPLGTFRARLQPNNIGGLNISVGSTVAKALNGQQKGGILPQIVNLYTIPAATNASNIAAAQTLGGAGYLTLTAGSGVQAVEGLVNYYTYTTDIVYYFLDSTSNYVVPRIPTVTLAGGGTPTDVTIWGYDQDNVFMTDQVTSVAGSTINFNKSFGGITRVWSSDATGGQNISIGGGNLIGLTYVCNNATKIISSVYGASSSASQATIEQGSDTLVGGLATVSATTVKSDSVILINRTDPNGSTVGTPTSGTATLVAGTVTISTTAVTAGGIITLTNTGVNASAAGTPTSGTATLVAGTVTVATTAIKAGSIITITNTGVNASTAGTPTSGTATLDGSGTITVNTTAVGAGSIITLTRNDINASTALGELTLGTITPGVSFVINSLSSADATTLVAADTSIVGWSLTTPQIGSLTVGTITPDTSFDISSIDPVSGALVTTDVSSVGWSIIEPQIGSLTVTAVVPGVSFDVTSINPVSGATVTTDVSSVGWSIIEPQIGSLTVASITPDTSFDVTSIDPVSGALITTDVSKFAWQIATVDSASAGTTPAAVTLADLTYPATITTGDIRGYASMVADGTAVISVVYMAGGSLLEVNNQNYRTLYGVPQFAAAYY